VREAEHLGWQNGGTLLICERSEPAVTVQSNSNWVLRTAPKVLDSAVTTTTANRRDSSSRRRNGPIVPRTWSGGSRQYQRRPRYIRPGPPPGDRSIQPA
jgi:hypothetical protein